ncbi:hypothetical protein GO495_20520 [Chitinophaga oryziterrae]|uniref:Uncharacterized protein n=1 Tax=Chitinophaga oryziterrae TaxID=1031224 RepID=A0A6N8JCQ3_9BACT|nr:hypothetical protein [Chitinophaga oryziterrae]MVT42993.1 hypothetical protein [Chitinophaga oryziterrae]
MKKYISLLLLTAVLFSCKKDHTPAPSASINDPFIRMDNAASDADHQIYLLYKSTGVPVLYTDTLTTSPLTLLNVGYHITSYDSLVTVRYLHSQDDVLSGVNFVKDEILPSLGAGLRPYSILLADSVYTYNIYKQQVILNAYLGLQTLAVGRVGEIKTMPEDVLKAYKKDIFKNILLTQLAQHDDLLKDFYAVSAAYYNKYAYGDGSYPGYIPYQPKEAYGLLTDGTEYPGYYPTGDQTTDLANYLDVVLVLSADEFAQKYADYPLVLTKYDLLVKVLTTLEFKMP